MFAGHPLHRYMLLIIFLVGLPAGVSADGQNIHGKPPGRGHSGSLASRYRIYCYYWQKPTAVLISSSAGAFTPLTFGVTPVWVAIGTAILAGGIFRNAGLDVGEQLVFSYIKNCLQAK